MLSEEVSAAATGAFACACSDCTVARLGAACYKCYVTSDESFDHSNGALCCAVSAALVLLDALYDGSQRKQLAVCYKP
jgi:hypothetical protein